MTKGFVSFIKTKMTRVSFYRQSDRSRGFGFIKMATVEDAGRCIAELNGVVSFVIDSSLQYF